MSYLIVVFPNRIQVEAAYTALEKEDLPTEQISILGDGYKSADEYGLINPIYEAKNNTQRLAYWLVPLCFAAGYALILLTNLEIILISDILNKIVGGLLGAASGLLAAFVIGGRVKLEIDSGDSWLYRARLNAGKYLIIFQGTEELVNKATGILHSFEIEDISDYVETSAL